MKTFESFDGTRIACDRWGEDGRRPWVVLHHGLVADAHLNLRR